MQLLLAKETTGKTCIWLSLTLIAVYNSCSNGNVIKKHTLWPQVKSKAENTVSKYKIWC